MSIKVISPIPKQNKPTTIQRIRRSIIAKQCDIKFPDLQVDSVELSPIAKIHCQANRIFSRSKKFSIQDYSALTKLEKAVLREACSEYRIAAEDSLRVGLKVKEALDRKYDEGKYVFCSIGTSPSGIARVLEFLGTETKYLPISRLNWLDSVGDWKKHSHKFSSYQKFLNEQGLSSESVAKSDKKYLFCDFVQQGMSLIVFEKMMKEHFGLDLPNVEFRNMNYLCYSSCAEKIDPPQYSVDYVQKYMNEKGIEELGGVPHLNIVEIDKIDECKEYENGKAKMFNFIIIDELARKGLLKENINNKNAL